MSDGTIPPSPAGKASLTPQLIDALIQTVADRCLRTSGSSEALEQLLRPAHSDFVGELTKSIRTAVETHGSDAATLNAAATAWLNDSLPKITPPDLQPQEARELLQHFLQALIPALLEVWSPDLLRRLVASLAPPSDPARPNAPQDSYLSVLSALPYQALREALYKNTFERVEDAPWPTATLDKGSVRGHAQLRPAAMDAQPLMPPDHVARLTELMWRQREELSDLDADALDMLSCIWIRQARKPEDYAVAEVDQLLEMRGIRKKCGSDGRRGGYEPEQRAETLLAVCHIQNIWLNITEAEVYEDTGRSSSRKRTKLAVQSRPFVITDRIGQLHLDGYNMDVHRFFFQPGKVFAHFLFGPGRQTALLSAKALHYDPIRQRWEKRLARYLSWQWRTQARRGNYARPYKVATLLEAIGEPFDTRNPARTRARLEKALDALRDDQVIAGWQYDRWDEDVAARHSWASVWTQATLLIEPPETIQQTYRNLELHQRIQQSLLPPAASFGETIRRRRVQLGLSQLQAAEQLDITQGYLSKLERGRGREEMMSAAIKKRIEAWLS